MPRRSSKGGQKEKILTTPPPWLRLAHVAAQHCARQAKLALPVSPYGFYILLVSSGLRASPFLVSTPATIEIHAVALLCLLRGAQRWV